MTKSENHDPSFIKRVETVFVTGQMSLKELSDKSEDMFGLPVNYELIKSWSKEFDWPTKRRQHRTFCPHCQGDITEIITGGRAIDTGYIYISLITRMFDEIMSESKVDPRKVAELKNLMKEAGLKVADNITSGRSDLDTVLDTAREKGII